MKAKYILPIMAAAMAGLTSCSDFLTQDPKGQIAPETYFQSQKDLDGAVNALYAQVQTGQCNSNPTIVFCQGSDVTSTTGSNKAAYLSADAFEDPTDTKGVEAIWSSMYNLIVASNFIIDNAENTPVAQEEINIALGQAYFWRAYAYFTLVRVFGPLPVNLHNTPDGNSTSLSSVSDVYKLIVEDLTKADNLNLPAEYTSATRAIGDMNIYITAQSVKALLGAVYMNMAGYPLNKTEYYANAADVLKQVVDGVNSGAYGKNGLLDNWADVYSYGNNFSKECMVGIVFLDQPGSWDGHASQFTSCHQLAGSFGGWGDFLAERYFWSQYPDGPRKDYVYAKQIGAQALVTKDAEGNNVYNTVDWWATTDRAKYNGENAIIAGTGGGYRPMFVGMTLNSDESGAIIAAPYKYNGRFFNAMTAPKTHQLIRYSEVLCWFAESAARSGKYQSDAQAALQKVMDRAYTHAPSAASLSGDALAEAAYNEHRYEVAGNVYSLCTVRDDEFRMNRLKDVYDYRKGSQTTVLVPKGTLTHSFDIENGVPVEYTLAEDVVVAENMSVTAAWQGVNSIYMMYPPKETEKNPAVNVAAREALNN